MADHKPSAETDKNAIAMLPEMARLDARRFGRKLTRQFRDVRNNAKLARELCKVLFDQICPPKRVGRPASPEVTKAELLLKTYRKQFEGRTRELWDRIGAEVHPRWKDFTAKQKKEAIRKLKNQLTARRSARRKWRRVRRQRAQESAQVLFSEKNPAPVFLASKSDVSSNA